jgi:hypothetical protein
MYFLILNFHFSPTSSAFDWEKSSLSLKIVLARSLPIILKGEAPPGPNYVMMKESPLAGFSSISLRRGPSMFSSALIGTSSLKFI